MKLITKCLTPEIGSSWFLCPHAHERMITKGLKFNSRSDAESVSTSVSHSSNKENMESSPSPAESTVAPEDAGEVVLRRKADFKVRISKSDL